MTKSTEVRLIQHSPRIIYFINFKFIDIPLRYLYFPHKAVLKLWSYTFPLEIHWLGQGLAQDFNKNGRWFWKISEGLSFEKQTLKNWLAPLPNYSPTNQPQTWQRPYLTTLSI